MWTSVVMVPALPQVNDHKSCLCFMILAFNHSYPMNIVLIGGSDNVVVIWKSSGQGLLRYNHTAPIQRVKYNPSSLQLASCSDVGLRSIFAKNITANNLAKSVVIKHKYENF